MWSHVHIHLSLKVFSLEFARSKWKNSAPKKNMYKTFCTWFSSMMMTGKGFHPTSENFSFRPNLESNLRCVKGKSGPITYKAMELGTVRETPNLGGDWLYQKQIDQQIIVPYNYETFSVGNQKRSDDPEALVTYHISKRMCLKKGSCCSSRCFCSFPNG